jgi:hypothetical protein
MRLLAVVTTATLALGLTVASADANVITTADFAFSNDNGNVAGTVTGTVSMISPDNSGTADLTRAVITSAPAGVGFANFPVDILSLGWKVWSKAFTLDNGVITDARVLVAAGGGSTAPSLSLGFEGFNQLNNISGQFGVSNASGSGAITFSNYVVTEVPPAPIPLPASHALLAGALAALGFAAKRPAIRPVAG